MNWGNVLIKTKEVQPDGSYHMTGEYLPEDKDFKTTKKITWLAEGTNLIVANLIEYDHLIKTPKVEEDQNFEDIVNVNSKFVSRAYIDSGLRLLNESNSIFMQMPFCKSKEEPITELTKFQREKMDLNTISSQFQTAKKWESLQSRQSLIKKAKLRRKIQLRRSKKRKIKEKLKKRKKLKNKKKEKR